MLRGLYIVLILSLAGLLTFSPPAQAQIQTAAIKVSGLTCSQCSRSVEMGFKKLPFVKWVKANLETTTFTLVFRGEESIDLRELAKAPAKAGFTTEYIQLGLDFSRLPSDAVRFKIDRQRFIILGGPISNRKERLRYFWLVNEQLMSAKQMERYGLLKPFEAVKEKADYYLIPVEP